MDLHGIQDLVDQVINVDQIQFDCRVRDRDREVPCDVVTERRHRGIVVRAAPFTEQVRPVSYTHLDVYKRQDPDRPKGY